MPSKVPLRKDLLAKRKALFAAAPLAGARAAGHLPQRMLSPPGLVAGYHAMGSEIDPAEVLAKFQAAGWQVGYPEYTHAQYKFHICSKMILPDLVITPLVGFDRAGNRLGRGGGWYDRAIAGVRDHKPVLVIGLAFAGQEVECVPAEPHDITLDGILTEVGYIDCSSKD